MLMIEIEYVDCRVSVFPATLWRFERGDGVYSVTASLMGQSVKFENASLYWCYEEGKNWVLGQGSVRYDKNPLVEIVIAPDGSQSERKIEFFPDLKLNNVKLGAWRGKNILLGR